ncbi:uncharacterized protein HMPREF1541_00191 [Cyphellophora europaea CBS 101466]|uniref:Uncharacterized protein n=1 Tax=Cyphellophora europaea (strain CBS 101466) TaxID=1220924 RepID=W2SDA3_CYPE1|nr:uncharacterized protein HMPREF1541_00191 [Cyphellophora europaea CBS 101466]ETN46008.1 hypothetical protein HMPREF1541_00191 [Cyphellophora europaea CBS 101466]
MSPNNQKNNASNGGNGSKPNDNSNPQSPQTPTQEELQEELQAAQALPGLHGTGSAPLMHHAAADNNEPEATTTLHLPSAPQHAPAGVEGALTIAPARIPTAVNAPVTADDVRELLHALEMADARTYTFITRNIPSNLRQLQIIARIYNNMGPTRTLTNAITTLEDADWNLGEALQNWRRIERLRGLPAEARRQDQHNYMLDRSGARGGQRFHP